MKFKSKTEKEIQEALLLPPGEYDFEVVAATERLSKKGNPMIELKLKVFTDSGSERMLTDYLLESVDFKLRHFCETTGMLDLYNQDELKDFDCVGKAGKCVLAIQQDKSGQYPDRNGVRDYVAREVVPPKFDEDLPF